MPVKFQHDDLVIIDYIKNKLLKIEICNKYDISRNTLDSILRRNNIKYEKRSKSRKNVLTSLTKDKLIDLYEIKRISITDISKSFGVDTGAIIYWLKKFGIPIRSSNKKSCRFNLSQLSESNKGYLAGFIDGEGSITRVVLKSGRTFWQVILCNSDYEVMKYFSELLNYKLTVREAGWNSKICYNTKAVYRLHIMRTADVYHILEVVSPYLRIKKSKALEALQWCKSHYHNSKGNAMVEVQLA